MQSSLAFRVAVGVPAEAGWRVVVVHRSVGISEVVCCLHKLGARVVT